MAENKVFRSFAEIKAYYCPEQVRKEWWESLSAKEKGKELARQTAERLKARINETNQATG